MAIHKFHGTASSSMEYVDYGGARLSGSRQKPPIWFHLLPAEKKERLSNEAAEKLSLGFTECSSGARTRNEIKYARRIISSSSSEQAAMILAQGNVIDGRVRLLLAGKIDNEVDALMAYKAGAECNFSMDIHTKTALVEKLQSKEAVLEALQLIGENESPLRTRLYSKSRIEFSLPLFPILPLK